MFGGTPSGADPTIRVYYDGQGPGTPPSLEYRLFMAHGLGPCGCTGYAGQGNCPAAWVTAELLISGGHGPSD